MLRKACERTWGAACAGRNPPVDFATLFQDVLRSSTRSPTVSRRSGCRTSWSARWPSCWKRTTTRWRWRSTTRSRRQRALTSDQRQPTPGERLHHQPLGRTPPEPQRLVAAIVASYPVQGVGVRPVPRRRASRRDCIEG